MGVSYSAPAPAVTETISYGAPAVTGSISYNQQAFAPPAVTETISYGAPAVTEAISYGAPAVTGSVSYSAQTSVPGVVTENVYNAPTIAYGAPPAPVPTQQQVDTVSYVQTTPQVVTQEVPQTITETVTVVETVTETVASQEVPVAPVVVMATPIPMSPRVALRKVEEDTTHTEFKNQVKVAASQGNNTVTIPMEMAFGILERGIPESDTSDIKPLKVARERRKGGCC